jgi:hypothetical protein
MLRRIVFAGTIILGAGTVVSLAPMASASAMTPTTGTYKFDVQQESPFTVVLEDHGAVAGGSGSWSVHKHIIKVHIVGAPAGPIICEHNGQPPNCVASSTYVGPKTATGIASSSAEGTATGYVGTNPVITESFYAVRTGGVSRT